MRTNIAVVVLSLLFLIPATGNAASQYGESSRSLYPGKVYLGIKYGSLRAQDLLIFNPVTGMDQEEDSDIGTMGFVAGGSINDLLSMEFEYNYTVSKDYFGSLPAKLEGGGWGLYLAAKTQGDLYFKGRLGYTQTEFDGSDGSSSGSITNYGVAGGVGVGLKLGPGALEIEYTVFPKIDRILGEELDDDLDSDLITIGYIFTYD
mgnify:FL=1